MEAAVKNPYVIDLHGMEKAPTLGKTSTGEGASFNSDRTVQKHLEHVYQKLGVGTRTTATVRALSMLGGT